ncbi:putative reverse transcriptase domain-containing protein [Tanacetum coccineum]
MLEEFRLRCPTISRWVKFCYSSPARLYYGEHTLWSCQGVQQGDPFGPLLFSLVLHPLICKIRDSFSLSLQAWYLDDGTIIGDTLVMGKVLELIIEDGPRCGLHLNVDKTKVFWPKEDPKSRLASVFSPNIARPLHDYLVGLLCELLLLRACAGISKLYFAMRTCSPQVFEMAQRSLDAALCSALERIVTASGLGFDWSLIVCRLSCFDILMALWQSQMEDHTSDWHRVVLISGLGQTMNGKTYRCVLCYRLGVPLFSVSKPCSACSKVFTGDIYRDHDVSCAGISAGKEVDIGLVGGRDKPLHPADMLLYSWDEGLDVCVDLTGSSPLTQTVMVDFVPGRAVIDAAHRKRVKYEAKCANIGYGFLPFSFSSLGELEKNVVTLLKRIRKFSVTQDIGARATVHIFNRISFSIAK